MVRQFLLQDQCCLGRLTDALQLERVIFFFKSEILKQKLENAKFLIFDFLLLHLPVMQYSYLTLNITNNGKTWWVSYSSKYVILFAIFNSRRYIASFFNQYLACCSINSLITWLMAFPYFIWHTTCFGILIDLWPNCLIAIFNSSLHFLTITLFQTKSSADYKMPFWAHRTWFCMLSHISRSMYMPGNLSRIS